MSTLSPGPHGGEPLSEADIRAFADRCLRHHARPQVLGAALLLAAITCLVVIPAALLGTVRDLLDRLDSDVWRREVVQPDWNAAVPLAWHSLRSGIDTCDPAKSLACLVGQRWPGSFVGPLTLEHMRRIRPVRPAGGERPAGHCHDAGAIELRATDSSDPSVPAASRIQHQGQIILSRAAYDFIECRDDAVFTDPKNQEFVLDSRERGPVKFELQVSAVLDKDVRVPRLGLVKPELLILIEQWAQGKAPTIDPRQAAPAIEGHLFSGFRLVAARVRDLPEIRAELELPQDSKRVWTVAALAEDLAALGKLLTGVLIAASLLLFIAWTAAIAVLVASGTDARARDLAELKMLGATSQDLLAFPRRHVWSLAGLALLLSLIFGAGLYWALRVLGTDLLLGWWPQIPPGGSWVSGWWPFLVPAVVSLGAALFGRFLVLRQQASKIEDIEPLHKSLSRLD